MNVDRAVFAMAGTMVLASLLLWLAGQPLLAAARGFCRGQHAAGRLHRLLPGRHDLQQARPQAGRRVFLRRARALNAKTSARAAGGRAGTAGSIGRLLCQLLSCRNAPVWRSTIKRCTRELSLVTISAVIVSASFSFTSPTFSRALPRKASQRSTRALHVVDGQIEVAWLRLSAGGRSRGAIAAIVAAHHAGAGTAAPTAHVVARAVTLTLFGPGPPSCPKAPHGPPPRPPSSSPGRRHPSSSRGRLGRSRYNCKPLRRPPVQPRRRGRSMCFAISWKCSFWLATDSSSPSAIRSATCHPSLSAAREYVTECVKAAIGKTSLQVFCPNPSLSELDCSA